MELLISEKPSAAKRIAQSLADGKPLTKKEGKVPWYEITHGDTDIIVGCAAGHLFTVAEKEKSFEYPKFDLEWKASGDVDKNANYTKQYLRVLQKLAKRADTFTVATDYDIEGEVIGLNIVRYVCNKDDARRMKFSTLTQSDLLDAYSNADDHLDWGQAKAGETRHFLDWMYGINLSRALMQSVKEAGSFKILSIGRVQGPALKIVVDKEREIQAFEPEPYWQVKAMLTDEGKAFEAWHTTSRFWEEQEANDVFDSVSGDTTASVVDVDRSQYKHPAPNPFNLGSLQSAAYRAFGFNPKQTLQVAQNLYTAGYISYPRTDSQKLPRKIGYEEIMEKLAKQDDYAEHVDELLGAKLTPNNGDKTDPAHPAIYPTGVQPKNLTGQKAKVYDLVVKRFLATFGEWATREKLNVELSINDQPFKAGGKRTIKPGWHRFYQPYLNLKETELPDVEEDDTVDVTDVELLDKETQPPRRYTQASLVSELEKRNLGTKATRADIVKSLYDRNYVDGKSIEVTRMGMETIATMEQYVPDILDEELTKHFEEEMEKIRQGKMEEDEVLKESKKILTDILERFDENIEEIGENLRDAYIKTLEDQSYLGPCPNCDEGDMRIRKGKYGKFAACDNYPDCKTTQKIPKNAKIVSAGKVSDTGWPIIKVIKKGKRPQEISLNPDDNVSDKVKKFLDKVEAGDIEVYDDESGSKMVVRSGPYGKFLGAEDYPDVKKIIDPEDIIDDYEDQL
jgi:DNA topoisomerase-1